MTTEHNAQELFDTAIVGAGPAALSASVYLSRYGIRNVIIGDLYGGLTTKTHEIGNWLGDQAITGFDFATKAIEHAKSYDASFVMARVRSIEREQAVFALELDNGGIVHARTVLLATGTEHRHLNIPGEAEFAGRGVSYCATCDGFFFKDKTVAVVGGRDSAAVAALYLADIAAKVYIIYRGSALQCEPFWRKRIEDNPKVEVICDTNLTAITGNDTVSGVTLDTPYKGSNALVVDGVFVEIGSDPKADYVGPMRLMTDDEGYVAVDAACRTTIEGIWAAGDLTTGSNKFKQIVTAAAEGAIAANDIQRYLKQ